MPKIQEINNQKQESSVGKVKDWKKISPDFTPELRKEWEDKGFSYEQTKEWIDSGLTIHDSDYVQWLKVIEEIDTKWILNHENDQELRAKYKEFLTEVKNGSKLSAEVIKQIKDLPRYYDLTPKQNLLINRLIPNKELKEHYRRYGLCKECKQPNTKYAQCQSCILRHLQNAFASWTSGSPEVDKFIHEYQIKVISNEKWRCMLEWIPYEKFKNIEYLAEGGFGKVYKAKWTDGPIGGWNYGENKWDKCDKNYERIQVKADHFASKYGWRIESNKNIEVVLKSLNNSREVTTDFLQEVASHKLFDFNSNHVVKCYGISQDPETKNYMMVMQCIPDGSLWKTLGFVYNKLNFYGKIQQLNYITKGLSHIHERGLMHRDFHPGNILSNVGYNNSIMSGDVLSLGNNYSNTCRITDLGLCRPANETDKGKIFGVLPYVAPEILHGKGYSQASDIYSLGIVAYELFTGLSPYSVCDTQEKCYKELPHSPDLAIAVCVGLRPNLNNFQAPQVLKDLISKCWEADPSQRPTAAELVKTLDDWEKDIYNREQHVCAHSYHRHRENEEITRFYQQYKELQKSEIFNAKGYPTSSLINASLNFGLKTHPQSICTSRLLDFINLPEPQNSKEINEKFYSRQVDLASNDCLRNLVISFTDEIGKLTTQYSPQAQSSFQTQIEQPPKQ